MINYQLLKKHFEAAAKRYRLSPAAKKTAWESALQCPEKAYACYRAIACSLIVDQRK